MIATLESPNSSSLDLQDHPVWVRLGNGSSRIRATGWKQAAWLRRKLHDRGWMCTSPSPSIDPDDYTFFVAKGPATIRRDLQSELESFAGVRLMLEVD